MTRPSFMNKLKGALTEIKASVSAHKLQRVHQLRPAQRLRALRLRRRPRQREDAQQQREGVATGAPAHDALRRESTAVRSHTHVGSAGARLARARTGRRANNQLVAGTLRASGGKCVNGRVSLSGTAH